MQLPSSLFEIAAMRRLDGGVLKVSARTRQVVISNARADLRSLLATRVHYHAYFWTRR